MDPSLALGGGGGGGSITNIDGGDDTFNRYKMPRIVGKVEGRGNGIKTRIVNCAQVAKAIHRQPGYVCKFFGCELGAQTKISERDDVFIVNGAHGQKTLAEVLNKFIRMYVMCPNCNLPETDLVLDKKDKIYHSCNACGARELVDMTHRVTTYMLNNPPEGAAKKGKSSSLSKKERREKKSGGGNSKKHGDEPDDGECDAEEAAGKKKKGSKCKRMEGESEEEYRVRRAAEKEKRRAERKAKAGRDEGSGEELGMTGMPAGLDEAELAKAAELAQARNGDGHNGSGDQCAAEGAERNGDGADGVDGDSDDDDDVEWSADTSKEAQAARAAQGARVISILADADESGNASREQSCSAAADTGADADTDAAPSNGVAGLALGDQRAERQEALESFLRAGHTAGPVVAAEACRLFGSDRVAAAQAIFRAIVLHGAHPSAKPHAPPARNAPATVDALRALKLDGMPQRVAFLSVLAELCVEEGRKQWVVSVPHVLKLYFDEDVLEEEAIVAWYDVGFTATGRASAAERKAREVAKPVVDWLMEEDDEEEEDEEE